jgi:hypothetical protein
MKYAAARSLEILARTPAVLRAMLGGVSQEWTHANYGADTFSPFDVVGHMIHGEKTDWMVRTHWIREKGASEPFPPYDRFAQLRDSRGKTLAMLLDEFESLRRKNLDELSSLRLGERDLAGAAREARRRTQRQLLATGRARPEPHRRRQGARHQHKDEVGAWREFLPILLRPEDGLAQRQPRSSAASRPGANFEGQLAAAVGVARDETVAARQQATGPFDRTERGSRSATPSFPRASKISQSSCSSNGVPARRLRSLMAIPPRSKTARVSRPRVLTSCVASATPSPPTDRR